MKIPYIKSLPDSRESPRTPIFQSDSGRNRWGSVKDSNLVSKELTALINGMQITIKEKMEKVVTKLHKKSDELITQAKDTMEEIGKVMIKISNITEKEKPTTTTYQDALTQGITGPPIQVDLQIRAKESIRARQFLWTLSVDVQDLKSMPAPHLLKQLNEKLAKAAGTTSKTCKLHSAIWLKNSSLLIEAGDNKSAKWLQNEANILHMECELSTTILTELHNYNTMAYFVPLTSNTKNDSHIEEVTKTNSLSRESISECRWAKAPK